MKYYRASTARLVIFEYSEKRYGYLVENFEPTLKNWLLEHEVVGFETLSDLYDEIDFIYEDAIFED